MKHLKIQNHVDLRQEYKNSLKLYILVFFLAFYAFDEQ